MSRRAARVFCIALVLAASGCGDEVYQTTYNGVDCGLVRSDLTGDWQVRFEEPLATTLLNCVCDVPACDTADYDGLSVAAGSVIAAYGPVTVYGSESSASFQLIGDRADVGGDPAVFLEFYGSFQADSCLALFRVWDSDDRAYFQCIGTFDRGTRSISATCDSIEVDPGADGEVDVTCDTADFLNVDASPI